ncbi:MAG: hypothetical protein P4L27_09850 [Ignavibacteriaceae bacterium]|nr:hypothetical protein [Ignavibacteriaceae bacterium]
MAAPAVVNILVVGRHPEILNKVLELIHKNTPYIAAGTLTDDEAVKLFNKLKFDLVLFCQGIDPSSDKKLRHIFNSGNPGIKIIQHFGGGSGLLYNELRAALE